MGLHMQKRGYPLDGIRHWIVHTGGQTVIDSASASLGLDLAELEPTVRALKRYGNNSSTSFFFAFDEWLGKPPCTIAPGDPGAFVTMGPGTGLEMCLWTAGSRAESTSSIPLDEWVPGGLPSASRSSLLRRVDDPETFTADDAPLVNTNAC
jgi:hypothetical protein